MSALFCVCDCIAESAYVDPCPPLKASTMGTEASELDFGAVEEKRLL